METKGTTLALLICLVCLIFMNEHVVRSEEVNSEKLNRFRRFSQPKARVPDFYTMWSRVKRLEGELLKAYFSYLDRSRGCTHEHLRHNQTFDPYGPQILPTAPPPWERTLDPRLPQILPTAPPHLWEKDGIDPKQPQILPVAPGRSSYPYGQPQILPTAPPYPKGLDPRQPQIQPTAPPHLWNRDGLDPRQPQILPTAYPKGLDPRQPQIQPTAPPHLWNRDGLDPRQPQILPTAYPKGLDPRQPQIQPTAPPHLWNRDGVDPRQPQVLPTAPPYPKGLDPRQPQIQPTAPPNYWNRDYIDPRDPQILPTAPPSVWHRSDRHQIHSADQDDLDQRRVRHEPLTSHQQSGNYYSQSGRHTDTALPPCSPGPPSTQCSPGPKGEPGLGRQEVMHIIDQRSREMCTRYCH